MREYYHSDKELLFDIKQRGIILALNEYIRKMRNIALREAILSRYIVVNEIDEESYQDYMTWALTADTNDLNKCKSFKYKRVQKYWRDIVKDGSAARVRFFFSEILPEFNPYHYHEMRQISLILNELP